jgi:beta-galactosidase/beta-glucuronidase
MQPVRFALPLMSVLFCLVNVPARAAAPDWKPAPAPLMTRWAGGVSPGKARTEYPRPDAVRKEWMNLNGLWQFAFDDDAKGRAAGWASGHDLPQHILVPWTFEAPLSGIGKGSEVHERVWYRRLFEVPKDWHGKRTLLHFGAVDWESTVWVNGKELGTHQGGYTPFSYDITDALKATGPQEIVVAVYDPADPKKDAYQPKGKQMGSNGIWYTRTTGIWQTVWLEPVNPDHILSFTATPDAHNNEIDLSIKLPANKPFDLEVDITDEGDPVISDHAEVTGPTDLNLPVHVPRLWSPESPVLYNVTMILRQGGRTLDEVKTYCAFRTISIANGHLLLNGKPYFVRGVLDQGFWPDGVYTAPSDAAIKNDVQMAKAFGFNAARKHVKVEDPRWYYWCDKLGLLVAQDMPSSFNLSTDAAKTNFLREWQEILANLHTHPCIMLWITFNENWGDPKEFQDQVVDLTRAADPSRPIIDDSGGNQGDKTDLADIHDYGVALSKYAVADPARPRWIGEFGGVALPVTGHTWTKGWGYQTVSTPDELVAAYRTLAGQINDAPGLSGYVYTQLTDVEQELNGLMTYDRIPKAPPGKIAAINRNEQKNKKPEAAKPTAKRERAKPASKTTSAADGSDKPK